MSTIKFTELQESYASPSRRKFAISFYENRYIVPKLRPEKSPDKDNKMVMMDT
jgi:hypothetical protein